MARNSDALLLAALIGLGGGRPASTGSRAIISDAKEARELREIMAELEKKIRSDLPGLSKKAVERAAEMSFGVTVALGEDCVSPAMLEDAVSKLTEVLVAAKVEWAAELVKASYTTKYKPVYDNAIKAGVDPVVVFQANFQMTKDKAQKLVDAIRHDETSGTSLSKEK